MYFISNSLPIKSIYFNLLLALLPFSFIAGNMIININLLLIVLSALIIFNKQVFNIKYYFIDKLIILFFCTILFTGFINDYGFRLDGVTYGGFYPTTIKSLFFFRYLLFYFVIRFLIHREVLNLKFFFISCGLSSLFVSLDIFFQFFNGKDIFGYETIGSGRKLGGPFGDELIAGSFIQRFSIFSFFIFPAFFLEKSKKLNNFITPALLIIFFLGIILSGNRMPLILFIFTIFLIIIFNNEVRKYLLYFLATLSIIFIVTFNINKEVNYNFKNLYQQVSKMPVSILKKNFNSDKNTPLYLVEFSTFYDTWLMNKYLGGGIKNFRWNCHFRPNIDYSKKFVCNMHPHNYYLEILTETGLLGFVIVCFIFFFTLKTPISKIYFSNINFKDYKITPFIFLFISEIFPIKSTGSFFTTGNAAYLFLIMSILISLSSRKKLIEN